MYLCWYTWQQMAVPPYIWYPTSISISADKKSWFCRNFWSEKTKERKKMYSERQSVLMFDDEKGYINYHVCITTIFLFCMLHSFPSFFFLEEVKTKEKRGSSWHLQSCCKLLKKRLFIFFFSFFLPFMSTFVEVMIV